MKTKTPFIHSTRAEARDSTATCSRAGRETGDAMHSSPVDSEGTFAKKLATSTSQFCSMSYCRTGILPLLLILLMLGARAAAEDDPVREEAVREFEQAWVNACLKADVNWMKDNLTDDFVEVDPRGSINLNSKPQLIKEFESGKFRCESFTISNLTVRFYGDVAVVTLIADVKGTSDGKDISGKYAGTDVLVFRGGEWKAASSQATKVTR